MYIPKEILYFLLGFISFPIFSYALYEFVLKKHENKENKSEEKK